MSLRYLCETVCWLLLLGTFGSLLHGVYWSGWLKNEAVAAERQFRNAHADILKKGYDDYLELHRKTAERREAEHKAWERSVSLQTASTTAYEQSDAHTRWFTHRTMILIGACLLFFMLMRISEPKCVL